MLTHVRAVAKKEFRQILRDRRTLGMLLFLPAFLLIMYGYALNFDVKHLALAVLDKEKSQRSREFYERFTRSEYFDLKYVLGTDADIDKLMGEGRIHVAIVVPPRFSSSLLRGEVTPLQVIVNGEQAHVAGTAIGYVNAFVQAYSAGAGIDVLVRAGMTGAAPPLDPHPRVWFNPELRSSRFLVPGLMAFILMITVVVSTAFSVVREKERGSIEQIMVSPLKPAELLLGKTIPYVVISLASSHLVLLLGNLLFGVPVKGSYWVLLAGMVFFLVGGLGIGLLISTVAHTQQVAFLIAVITTLLPTFILSGFVFPIRNMPPVIQAITLVIPARYFLVILRSVMLKGVGVNVFWSQMVFLAAFAVLILVLSSLRLRRTLRRGVA
ncbi:MAG: ABC transporter permease [Candidatus Aminicenantes bacterium]|nr:ABC transporter permease [Candidatus Aminicenantes bacterium]